MSSEKHIEDLIAAFNSWYKNDSHSKDRNFYATSITRNNLEELDKSNFQNFFINFVREGGKVQTGGYRTINDFISTIESEYQEFRNFILQPFKESFNLEVWFQRLDKFSGFGVGIATIYLNRIDANYYPILNNKTISALNQLGYQLTSTKNFSNYQKVREYQKDLINKYPLLEDYYKADSLNHFIVSIPEGKFLITNYQQASSAKDTLEQSKIDFNIQDNGEINDVFDKIRSCESDESDQITIKGKTYKRNNYLFSLIKKYRDYTCQFCSTKLSIGDGKFYIEACHIKPKSEGGKDKLNNILVLCPNCHKIFDYSERKNEKRTDNQYKVTLNDTNYAVSLL